MEGKEKKTKDRMNKCRKGDGEERGGDGGGVKTPVLNSVCLINGHFLSVFLAIDLIKGTS